MSEPRADLWISQLSLRQVEAARPAMTSRALTQGIGEELREIIELGGTREKVTLLRETIDSTRRKLAMDRLDLYDEKIQMMGAKMTTDQIDLSAILSGSIRITNTTTIISRIFPLNWFSDFDHVETPAGHVKGFVALFQASGASISKYLATRNALAIETNRLMVGFGSPIDLPIRPPA